MKDTKFPYLYITGASYCGSTLLAFLLNTHPYMISFSEMGPMSRVSIETFQCSCGKRLLQCPFFLELERRVNALGSPFSLTNWQTHFHLSRHRLLDIPLVRPLRSVSLEQIRDAVVPLWPGYRQAVDAISQRISHVAQAALALSGKKVFVDAQKDAIRIKFLRDIEQLDLKVIHLVRDVRGAVASIMKNSRQDDVARATRVWYRANMSADQARRYVSSKQWLRLNYDALCADPRGTVDRISGFMKIPHAPMPHDFYQSEHHIIGNHMRLKGSGCVRRDESWKARLTERDLQIIARIGGKANRYFGHDWP